ncbi:Disks large 1 tumor suppressor protein [Lamellibrachia satsuma]|nr:Disks large 1 tumor suppressor protein [Lamellibrachia satsuma]
MNTSTGSLKTTQKRTLYVRALFDYDPSKDSGLSSHGLAFKYGDILHVTNASDDEWWQARKLVPPDDDDGLGIIPSKRRVERKERARLINVKFSGKGSDPKLMTNDLRKKKNFSFSRHFPFMKSKDQSGSEDTLNVEPIEHTTRLQREHEVDHRDYHFVESWEQMEADIQNHLFIEAGQYNSNLYGTSVASVREVAESGKHFFSGCQRQRHQETAGGWTLPCRHLHQAKVCRCHHGMEQRVTEEQARQTYERALKLEQEFGEYFTAVVTGDTPEEITVKVKGVIREQSGPTMWVPAKEIL